MKDGRSEHKRVKGYMECDLFKDRELVRLDRKEGSVVFTKKPTVNIKM